MIESPAAPPPGFTPRNGALLTSGIIFGLAGLNLCGLGLLMIFQWFLMDKLGGLDPAAAAQMESMKDMMGMASVINLVFYGGTGVLMIILSVGFFAKKRWTRPIALTLGWSWLYLGVVMVLSLMQMMGPMKTMMADAMKTAMATAPGGSPGPSMDGFFGVFMAIYFAVIIVFLILLPALLLWLNWGSDVRRTLELHDPRPRWTDRQPAPLIGMVVASLAVAVFSLPAFLIMNQPWMSQFLPGGGFRYLFYVIPFVWFYIAWGSYRGQLAAWFTALALIIASATIGIQSLQNVDWAVVYQQMGMPEAEVEKLAPMLTEMMSPKRMGILMAMSMLPILGFLIWVLRYFRKQAA